MISKKHKQVASQALHQAENICKQKDIKLTKLRQTVLKLVWKEPGYVKAYDLLEKLKKIDPSAKPPTIYRSLDFLIEHGFIHKLQSLNAFIGCSHPQEHKECYFLICDNCQKIEECCSNKILKAVESTSNQSKFALDQVTLEISGRCKNCLH